jgi:hypothetical protein
LITIIRILQHAAGISMLQPSLCINTIATTLTQHHTQKLHNPQAKMSALKHPANVTATMQ